MKRSAVKHLFALGRIAFALLLGFLQYSVGHAQSVTRIPPAIRVSREGRLPLPDVERQFLFSDLSAGIQKNVFPGPRCLSGRYYVGVQLLYDLGDRNTTQPWTADLEVSFLRGSEVLWTKPLRVDMGTQTFITTVFHDTLVSCDGNYYVAIKTKTASTETPQQNISLKVLLFKHLEEAFNPSTAITLNTSLANGYASVQWNHPGTATASYDLEWVFIEDHEPFAGATADAAFAYKEPVRISTANRYYQHALVYPKGRLWYRTRAVGYNPAYPTHRIPGQWFYSGNAGIAVNNTQADKTWQRQTAFTENGEYKHGVSYLDGSLRTRQQLTNLSSERRTLVGESLYDYEGRKSVEVMAVPAGDSALTYHANFHAFSPLLPAVADHTGAGRQKFNYDNYRLENSPMSSQVGAAQYYSPLNPFTSIHRNYTPQANGYVYSQTEYLNDATGRVSRQGGVGQRFRIDSLHASRQFYGTAVTEELVRLFGSNVGAASHYRKNLAVDANGQVSVTYQDQEGRTIATALAGEKPDNVQALPSYTALSLAPITVNAGTRNAIQDGVSTTVHTLLNTSPNTGYTFQYDLSAYAASLEQLGCQTCAFDLKITLTDPEGFPVKISQAIGNESTSEYSYERRNISAASCASPTPLNAAFTLSLPDIGNYTVVKTLTPHELSFEQLSTLVLANPSVQQQIQQIRDSYVVQPDNCAICTESCPEAESVIETTIQEVATRNCDNIYQQIVAYYQGKYGEAGEEPYQVPLDSIRAHPAYCEYLLCDKNQPSDVFEMQLARVDTWETAVSKGYHRTLDLDPFFNNPALSGADYKASAAAKLNDVFVATLPVDSNNDGTPDDSRTYRGPITEVIDPANTAFYIDEQGKPNPAGKHLLYLDLMGRRSQLSPAAYSAQLSQQRWTLYKSFYLEAKRKTKLEIPEYNNCPGAKASLQLMDGLPQTSDGITTYGETNGATGPVSVPQLQMSIAAIQNKCAHKLSAADSIAVAGHLQTYFNGNPKNFFRVILIEDLATNPSLVAIEAILQRSGCSLNGVAVANPISCVRDTTLYLPLPTTTPISPNPSTGNPSPTPTIIPPPPSTIEQERQALLALYNATGGPRWINKKGWQTGSLDSLLAGQWSGVTVSMVRVNGVDQPHVTRISFSNNRLNGSLPAALINLTYLNSLSISLNPNLTGPIPAEIGGLPNLSQLILNNNRLTGPIPRTIGLLQNLTYLQLSANQLTGSIPTEIGALSKLIRLYLMNNALTGSIPTSFGNLKQVYILQLSDNFLSGPIPAEIGGMTSLQMLALSNNKYLTGVLPTSICTIPTLSDLAIMDNQFTFEHLLYTIQHKLPGTSFSYNRQDSVDLRLRITVPVGRTLTFTAAVDRSTTPASLYQWFKVANGRTTALQASPSATAFTYTTPPLTLADIGTRYYYKITNPGARTLTLVSRTRTLVAGWVVNTCLAYDQHNPFSVVLSLNDLVAQCQANAAQENSILIQLAIDKLLEGLTSTAYAAYRTNCLNRVSEALRYTYASKEHHYTLYYYDQAGNLAQTVPPEGVKPLTPARVASFLAGNRTDPPHLLRTRYQYNSLNALVAQHTPDGGESRSFYNEKGQLRLSQNAEQRKNIEQSPILATKPARSYSYTRYDEQGRVREVGELATAQPLAALKDSLDSPSFPSAGRGDYQLADRTLTYYDFPKKSLRSVFAQQFLRSRVSWTAMLEKGFSDTIATYYSYDVHGNVRSLLQALPGLAPKRTDYRYDLVSGKVNYVFYQYGQADEFTHRYQYDADNRLTSVFTSSDGFLWNKEAKYQYYLHGPLARVELGEYRVQGLDHYYTLQGWLKGVNMPYAGDAGRDGSPGSSVGNDAFAYSLGYYQGDYQPLNASVALSDSRDKLWPRLRQTMGHQGLYNGNIAWMVTDLPKLGELANNRTKGMQGMLYQYDQLNRIVQSRSLTSYQAGSGFGARASGSAGAYDEDYSYDGNGNLLTLQRRDETAALQDDFRYAYYPGTNKLREVKPVAKDKIISSGRVVQDDIRYRNLTLTGSSYVASGKLVEVKALEKIQMSLNFRSAQGTDFWAHIVDNGTFQYDAIGNLVLDQDEGTKIQWTPYGKIRQVGVKDDSLLIRYRYDAAGNRVEKQVVVNNTITVTRYLRDASGNVMAIYKDGSLIEQPIYGSSRIGEYKGGVGIGTRRLGEKNYELSNHLGNVLATVSDKVGMQDPHVWASVTSTSDYYPFGLTMNGRAWNDITGYRFGFNGKEKDAEFNSNYDFGARIYDPRIGRWMATDPLAGKMSSHSPYNYAFDNPVSLIDPDGMMPHSPIYGLDGKYLGNDSKGFTGQVIFMSEQMFALLGGIQGGGFGANYSNNINHETALQYGQTLPQIMGKDPISMSPGTMNMINSALTDIVSKGKDMGFTISELHNGKTSTSYIEPSKTPNILLQIKTNDGNRSYMGQEDSPANMRVTNGTMTFQLQSRLWTTNGEFTVENIQNAAVHEGKGHLKGHVPGEGVLHAKAFEMQFHHSTWKGTTPKWKKEMIKSHKAIIEERL
ncbi:hypothetical protein IC235_15130 [Hymenobacter sp. BT664]|uniref:RHS repeat-associated core domain-containing protein n=1 Tax=Hymenobacter montanus TaxID=2771359 RepID=A0A927GK59_9BACT|nr:RHS repeat-associated core domain-containing protein [Hymenobacter montanus]MBD2769223.1 hypothetical protein [Hymenobacter montanus]